MLGRRDAQTAAVLPDRRNQISDIKNFCRSDDDGKLQTHAADTISDI
jgi:hypothetical protein